MRNTYGIIIVGAAALVLAACSEPTGGNGLLSSAALSGALTSAPAGYGDLSSSFIGGRAGDASGDSAGFHGGREGRRMGPGMMMGGGLHDAFLGGVGFGPRGRGGPFADGLSCDGTFDATTGRVECAAETLRNGLTVTRSAAYADASGAVQQAYDSLTTDRINVRSAVSGSFSFTAPTDSGRFGGGPRGDLSATDIAAHRGPGGRGGPGGPGRLLGDTARVLSATIAVSNASERTVAGLAQGSTQRTVSGISSGSETTTGTSTRGEFTATRTIADTTAGVVVPVPTTASAAWPTSGSVIRNMTATLRYTGRDAVSLTRREVVTYDGTATAKVTITENGTTRSCTRALPRGPLTCAE
jgi:hypothetical protein